MLAYILLVTLSEGVFFTLTGKGAIQCFNQAANPGEDISVAYVVSGERDQNVIATVLDNYGRTHFTSAPNSREGKLDLKVSNIAYYRLCFQSTDKTPKTISFEFYIQDGLEEEKILTQEEINPLRSSFRKLSRSLDTVYRNIQFYERRERTHRDLAELTCDRVVFSAIIKMAVLALISIGQIFMLRHLFNSNKIGI